MADTTWHRKVLAIVKQYPGLTARQVHSQVSRRHVDYLEVGQVLRGLERAGQVRSHEESTGDWMRERTWWAVGTSRKQRS